MLYRPGREIQMLVIVITMIFIWFPRTQGQWGRPVNNEQVILLGTLGVSSMVCMCGAGMRVEVVGVWILGGWELGGGVKVCVCEGH